MLHQYCIHVNILICPNSYVILVYRSKLTSDNQLRSPYFLVHTQLPFGFRHTCPLFCGIKLRSLRNINKTKHPKQKREMHVWLSDIINTYMHVLWVFTFAYILSADATHNNGNTTQSFIPKTRCCLLFSLKHIQHVILLTLLVWV